MSCSDNAPGHLANSALHRLSILRAEPIAVRGACPSACATPRLRGRRR